MTEIVSKHTSRTIFQAVARQRQFVRAAVHRPLRVPQRCGCSDLEAITVTDDLRHGAAPKLAPRL